MKKINLGIIGCGQIISDAYLPILPFIDNLESIHLYDINDDAVKARLTDYNSYLSDEHCRSYDGYFSNARKIYDDFKNKIFASSLNNIRKKCNVVLITTPPKFHLDMVRELLDDVDLIIVEKPLSIDSKSIKKFISDNNSKINKVKYLENFIHNPVYGRCKDIIKTTKIGDPIYIKTFLSNTMPEGGWRINKEIAGNGVLFDWGPHTLALSLFLLGIDTRNLSYTVKNSEQKLTNDMITYDRSLLTFNNSVSLLIENSWECSSDPNSLDGNSWIEIELTNGMIRIDLVKINGLKHYEILYKIGLRSETISEKIEIEFPHDSYYYALSSIINNDTEYANFDFGLKVIEIMEDIENGAE